MTSRRKSYPNCWWVCCKYIRTQGGKNCRTYCGDKIYVIPVGKLCYKNYRQSGNVIKKVIKDNDIVFFEFMISKYQTTQVKTCKQWIQSGFPGVLSYCTFESKA